ncbi:GATA zinc finger domain-containing protein 1 [Taenia solium]|eukprot:TsM_001079500 transcript=TsM_001079500 gene=TsM_001079500
MSADRAVGAFSSHANERACRRKRTAKTDLDFDFTGPMKKSLRSRGVTNKTKSSNGSSSSKCRSRRSIFKTNPTKLAPPRAFVRLESRILHKGKWLQTGDIVSLMDVEGGEYYAQIRSIIVDNAEDASVVLTWLVPTSEARRGEFDPAKYVIDRPTPLTQYNLGTLMFPFHKVMVRKAMFINVLTLSPCTNVKSRDG